MSPAVHDDAKFSQNISSAGICKSETTQGLQPGESSVWRVSFHRCRKQLFFYGLWLYDSYLSPFPLLIALAPGSTAGTLAGTVPGQAHCPIAWSRQAESVPSVELQQLQGQEQEQESPQSAASQNSSKIQDNKARNQVRVASQNTENPEKESGNRSS
ncbi:unnamed protein product [[Candida] boidinii]|uniref:Unnamed protein product n=1 Tax=Candida boidinii TaxID=5477 RepID=A0A9W6W892_CANBO|nr:unnamed protein product [[Candida] boidinii]GMG00417.1 unnamed protein product [[Candida] boidinii]